jgi:hypothetical protein
MSKQLNDIENLDGQSQKRAKLTQQDIEENSIDQLSAQLSQSSSRVSFVFFILGFYALHKKKKEL